MAPIPFRSDKDGVYNWPQYSRGSKKPATHTQQKITHVSPLGGVSNTYSSAIISILAMVPLSIFFQLLSLLIATLQVHISWILYPRVGHRRPLISICKLRLSGCYTKMFFLIYSSNCSGSWKVNTQESLRKCVTTTDHYSRWTTARFGLSKTRKTDMERSTLSRPRLTDWLRVPEIWLATTNPLIYLICI